MFKSFGLQVRREGLTHAAYMDHWLNVHAPLSAGVGDLAGYVLNEVLLSSADLAGGHLHPEFGASVDGVAQLWFSTRDGMARMAERPEVQRWFSDGPNYVGLRTGFRTEEHIIVSPGIGQARPAFKAICFLNEEPARATAALGASFGAAILSTIEVTGSTNLPNFEVPALTSVMEFWALEQGEAVRIAKTAATLLAPGALVSTLIVREIVVKVPPH